MERASIDEVYLDLSGVAAEMVSAENFFQDLLPRAAQLQDLYISHLGLVSDVQNEGAPSSVAFDWMMKRPREAWTMDEKLLLAGLLAAANLRRDVLDECGYTCSVGVAHNKLLAKVHL